MDKQLLKQYAASVFHAVAVVGSVACIIAIALWIIGAFDLAHATQSQALTPKQIEARRQMHIICTQGSPYSYSQCMVRSLQGQRLGVYVLTAPLPVVDVD